MHYYRRDRVDDAEKLLVVATELCMFFVFFFDVAVHDVCAAC